MAKEFFVTLNQFEKCNDRVEMERLLSIVRIMTRNAVDIGLSADDIVECLSFIVAAEAEVEVDVIEDERISTGINQGLGLE